jgi:hypothetical protein
VQALKIAVDPNLNNRFNPLIPKLEQVEEEWVSTYTANLDQELAPFNRRITGSGILSAILIRCYLKRLARVIIST